MKKSKRKLVLGVLGLLLLIYFLSPVVDEHIFYFDAASISFLRPATTPYYLAQLLVNNLAVSLLVQLCSFGVAWYSLYLLSKFNSSDKQG